MSFRQDATYPDDPRIAAKQHKRLEKVVVMTSTCLLNDFIVSFQHFYDTAFIDVCIVCDVYCSFGHITDTYTRPLTCDERTETIPGQIICIIRILLY